MITIKHIGYNAIIEKSKVKGKVIAPSSKSYTHRALICAALSKGKSKIISPLISDDTQATINVLKKLGVKIKINDISIQVEGSNFKEPKEDLFCGESGTTMRLMTESLTSFPIPALFWVNMWMSLRSILLSFRVRNSVWDFQVEQMPCLLA